jgi:hypothetical protein
MPSKRPWITKYDQSRKNNILHSFYKTHFHTRSVGPLLTAFVVPQATHVTIKRILCIIQFI